MLAFKVVDKETRYGSNVAMWRRHNYYSPKETDDYINRNNLQKWIFKYNVGSIIKAVPDSPGIMCFYTHNYAENFIDENRLRESMIIEVEGKDLMHCDMFTGKSGCGYFLYRLKVSDNSFSDVIRYKGLVTFKKVTVLN